MEEPKSTLLALITKLKRRLAQTNDSEPEQAFKLRLIMGIGLIVYFCLPWGKGETFAEAITSLPSLITLTYYTLAVAIAIAILRNPHPSPIRRVMGILLDLVSLSVVMLFSGAESVFLFVLYLWVILGNGFRYGTQYLYIALLIGVTGFSVAVSFGDYWQDIQHTPIALSLLFLMLLIPLYSAFLINKLHAALDSAKQANEAKSRFLANMSHELRTPLNGVIGIADLIAETPLSSQQREFVNIMRNSANTLLGLIENVLDISKIEAGKVTVTKEKFDLHQLINSIIQMQAPMAASKGINLICYIDPRVSYHLDGDLQHLRQVMINLIGNAIKFTDHGHVKLLVSAADNNMSVHSIRFEIQDTGIGIPKEALSTIFDDFTQVAATERQSGGTGLGTTISRELVELMGGEIGVSSQFGIGTTFWFELPITPASDHKVSKIDNHILLLSTEKLHSAITATLSNWHVNYEWVSSSARAFSQLMRAVDTDSPYQILIVDQACMRDIDPVQYAQMIKSEKLLEHLSLILINTHGYTQQDPRLSNYYISIVHDIGQKQFLFNAVHAAQSISIDDANVISLAEHFAAQSNAKPLSILIAEDNLVNQQVLDGVLKKAGHQTLLASTGEQALDLLTMQMDKIDMLILDMNMPELSGIEVLQALRYMDTSARIPVIILTADATPETRQQCLDNGANAFLTKPINSKALLQEVANLAPQHSSNNLPLPGSANKPKLILQNEPQNWFNEHTLAELAALGSDQRFMHNLINGFKQDGLKHIAIIKQAANDDYLTYRESLHALKGSSTEIGATILAELCLKGEQFKPYDVGGQEMSKLCKDIDNVFNKTVSALQSAFADPASEQKHQ